MRRRSLLAILTCAAVAGGAAALPWWQKLYRVEPPPTIALGWPLSPPLSVLFPSRPVRVPERGDMLGTISVPRLKLSVAVYEGDDETILGRGAGHVPGTALPGSPGNICIAAHRDKFFRALRFIQPKDEIVLNTKNGELRYQVNSTTIVKPADTQVLMPAPHRDLTLVTCYPFYYVGSAPRRFIVHAVREDTRG